MTESEWDTCASPAEMLDALAGLGIPAGVIREQVGNPFVPPVIENEWRTSDVLALARGIRAEKAFDRMPILADALMDSGFHDEGILNHCRHDKPHHDGCWVLSLLLGASGDDLFRAADDALHRAQAAGQNQMSR